MNEHYITVRDAVDNAAKGQDPLTIKELALAVSAGLLYWGNQSKLMEELAKEILEQTGQPWDVHNRAEEHE